MHNARANKAGQAFNSLHNDRNYDLEKSDNIDPLKTDDNIYWHCQNKSHPDKSFNQVEKDFYKKHFQKHLDEQNARHIAHRQMGRVKSIDDYRQNKLTCPEEQCIYLGDKDQTQIDLKMFWEINSKQIAWEQKTFPQVKILDIALHTDEPGANHIQIRKAWICHDDNGNEMIGQAKALKEMGIDRPDLSKPQTRYNNAKQTYSKMCRDHYLELCKEYGLDIELTPREKSKMSLDLITFKAQKEEHKLNQLTHEIGDKKLELEDIKNSCTENERKLKSLADRFEGQKLTAKQLKELENKTIWSSSDKADILKTAFNSAEASKSAHLAKEARDDSLKAQKRLKTQNTDLKAQNESLSQELDATNSRVYRLEADNHNLTNKLERAESIIKEHGLEQELGNTLKLHIR